MTKDPTQYNVGWICAIPAERTAAEVLLDQEYGTPAFVSQNDNNSYTLGRIKDHNVVIASLPRGEYGLSSAATVARDMLHSFPNIRIGLMVGIGGGAPSPRKDIRLGDVVVSTPCDGTGGVFQYDYGESIQDQTFHQTAVLDNPPQILRTASASLQSDHERHGTGIEEAISDVLGNWGRLKKKYSRPDALSDQLFDPDVTSDLRASSTDPIKPIPRTPRAGGDDDPAIHYGVIASGNQLIRDAKLRDKLAAEKGVLCFETEAAGLMNHFPCLVIRGICDYADTHQNEKWQGYAAMTAAAYAKGLISKIPLNSIENQMRINEYDQQEQEREEQERRKRDLVIPKTGHVSEAEGDTHNDDEKHASPKPRRNKRTDVWAQMETGENEDQAYALSKRTGNS